MKYLKAFFILIFLNCKILTYFGIHPFPIRGEFAWRSVEQIEFGPIEEYIFQPEEFYMGRERLYFSDHETIWWLYKFEDSHVIGTNFLVVLYFYTNPSEPIEIDLRDVQPESQEGIVFIRQYYNPLSPGKYIIKIAKKSDGLPFDSVDFMVLKKEEILQMSGPIQE